MPTGVTLFYITISSSKKCKLQKNISKFVKKTFKISFNLIVFYNKIAILTNVRPDTYDESR